MRRHRHSGNVRWLIAAALTLSVGHACAAEAPAAGQTVEEWREAVNAHLKVGGDRMGFSVEPCALNPPFVAATKTYLSRTFSQDETMELTLVAVKDGRVTQWKEFGLPGFQGWFTHALHVCKGKFLEIRFDGKLSQRYRWDGQSFTLVTRKPARR